MVWGLIPADPLSGEDHYYIFANGTYKVGRKGCDVIINKDKGVSRIHAEILVDAMISLNPLEKKFSQLSSNVRIRDCSKYGTLVSRNFGSKEKVHEFPKKETIIKDGDLVSFGTGNATYRFCFVPFVFSACRSETFHVNHPLQDKVLSIGAHIIPEWSPECTHVLVDEVSQLKEDHLLDAIVAKKPFALSSWVEFVAEKRIYTEIPSCSSYVPTVTFEGELVKVADIKSREKCLETYIFVLESAGMYKFGDKLQSLLEVAGAKILPVDSFLSSSQGVEDGESKSVVHVDPTRSTDKFVHSHKMSSLSRVDEIKLIRAVLSGHLDPSILTSQPVGVSSSCSTDETVVADSDTEAEVNQKSCVVRSEAAIKYEIKEDILIVNDSRSFRNGGKGEKEIDESESGNPDIIYSQVLIVRDVNLPTSLPLKMRAGFVDFKRFRKVNTESGNSFNNLIPFSKNPYKNSDEDGSEEVEFVKEEKKRKQMEAIAEDLFNNERGKRQRGAAATLRLK